MSQPYPLGASALIMLTLSPALEDSLIDWLLANDDISGFSSVPVRGHGAQHFRLSHTEQVTGRQRRVQFQIQLPWESVEEFIASARSQFTGTDVHFWVLPVLADGVI